MEVKICADPDKEKLQEKKRDDKDKDDKDADFSRVEPEMTLDALEFWSV